MIHSILTIKYYGMQENEFFVKTTSLPLIYPVSIKFSKSFFLEISIVSVSCLVSIFLKSTSLLTYSMIFLVLNMMGCRETKFPSDYAVSHMICGILLIKYHGMYGNKISLRLPHYVHGPYNS